MHWRTTSPIHLKSSASLVNSGSQAPKSSYCRKFAPAAASAFISSLKTGASA